MPRTNTTALLEWLENNETSVLQALRMAAETNDGHAKDGEVAGTQFERVFTESAQSWRRMADDLAKITDAEPAALDSPCVGEQPHDWALAEDGYMRTWRSELDAERQVVVAHYSGASDFTDDGDGEMFLQCRTCVATTDVPEGWEVDYR